MGQAIGSKLLLYELHDHGNLLLGSRTAVKFLQRGSYLDTGLLRQFVMILMNGTSRIDPQPVGNATQAGRVG